MKYKVHSLSSASPEPLQDNKEVFARGLLGGLVGHAIKCALLWVVLTLIYSSNVAYMLNITVPVIFMVTGLLPAIVLGVVAATIIKVVSVRRGRNIGVVSRVVMGILFMGTISVSAFLVTQYFPERFGDNFLTYAMLAIFYMDFGAIVGASVGILSGKQYQPQQKYAAASQNDHRPRMS